MKEKKNAFQYRIHLFARYNLSNIILLSNNSNERNKTQTRIRKNTRTHQHTTLKTTYGHIHECNMNCITILACLGLIILLCSQITSSLVQTGRSSPPIFPRGRQECNSKNQNIIRSPPTFQNNHNDLNHAISKKSSLSIATSDIVEDVKRRKSRKVRLCVAFSCGRVQRTCLRSLFSSPCTLLAEEEE